MIQFVMISAAVFSGFIAAHEIPNQKITDVPVECTDAQVVELAKKAYQFGYPMVEMARLRLTRTNVSEADNSGRAPINHFSHRTAPLTDKDTQVPSPNNDTLYSSGFLDLKREPVFLQIPAIKDRYFSFQFLSFENDTRGMIGTSIPGDSDGGRFMIVGPDWKGEPPPNVKRVLKMPTNALWVIGRTHFDYGNAEDMDRAKNLQSQFKLATAASQNAINPAPVLPKAKEMSAIQFFSLLGSILPEVPSDSGKPPLDKLGFNANLQFDPSKLSASIHSCIEQGVAAAKAEIVERTKNLGTRLPNSYWTVNMKVSDFGNDYLSRAVVAWELIGTLRNEEAVYLTSKLDSSGQPLNSQASYVMHFSSDEIPKAKAFWSLTLYDARTSLLVPSDSKRFSVNNKTLKRNKDGSIDILIQRNPPKDATMRANWLSLPMDGRELKLTTRLFVPEPTSLAMLRAIPPIFQMPPVKRVE